MSKTLDIRIDVPKEVSDQAARAAEAKARAAAVMVLQQEGELTVEEAAAQLRLSYEDYLNLLASRRWPIIPGLGLPSTPPLPRLPIDHAREDVRDKLHRFQLAFADQSARLAAGLSLKDSLQGLEREAARSGYEPLSRVALVLHFTLANNHMEDFDEEMLAGFLEAARQAVEVPPEQANPYDCEWALFKVGLSWLPEVDESEVDESEIYTGNVKDFQAICQAIGLPLKEEHPK